MMMRLYGAAGFERRDTSLVMGAVGGYGRRLLGLRSDLDFCFVTAGSTDTLLPLVEAVLYPLWDAGLSVGHHLISISDVAAEAVDDLPTATGLLDFRPLAGSAALALQERLSAGVFSLSRASRPSSTSPTTRRFRDAFHARRWFTEFFDWYANRHRHSGLALFTPADVFFGGVAGLAETRQLALDAAYQAHPERFVRGPPSCVCPLTR